MSALAQQYLSPLINESHFDLDLAIFEPLLSVWTSAPTKHLTQGFSLVLFDRLVKHAPQSDIVSVYIHRLLELSGLFRPSSALVPTLATKLSPTANLTDVLDASAFYRSLMDPELFDEFQLGKANLSSNFSVFNDELQRFSPSGQLNASAPCFGKRTNIESRGDLVLMTAPMLVWLPFSVSSKKMVWDHPTLRLSLPIEARAPLI